MDPGTYIALVARLESIAQHIAHTQTQTQSPSTSTSDQSEWTEAQGHLKIIADGLREGENWLIPIHRNWMSC